MAHIELKKTHTDEEIKAVEKLAYEIWHEHYRDIVPEGQISYMLEKFQSEEAIRDAIEREGYEYYLITIDGEVGGYIGIRPDLPEGKLLISKLYLRRELRGKGYARHVMDMMENMCRQGGMCAIWLTVNKENPAVSVYDSLGFIKTDSVNTDIGGGYFMDDYVMEKDV